MSESFLSQAALSSELAFIKTQLATLSTLKVKYTADQVPTLAQLTKGPSLAHVPVVEPPKPTAVASTSASPAVLNVTIKSSKPPMSFDLAAPRTSTISTLKALLTSTHPTAPKPDEQRWILKGKAMGDSRLLQEFPVEEGSVINLMIKAGAATTPAASAAPSVPVTPSLTQADAPELTLSVAGSSTEKAMPEPFAPEPTLPAPIANPKLWNEVKTLLLDHAKTGLSEDEAKLVWEDWFAASLAQGNITPSEKAKIRDTVGYSAMGGI